MNILFAEDFAAFREFACRELERRSDFRVVTVNDGLAAVQKAEELRPELILLDIGLPAMDGLTAARRIRKVCPDSKIVFLTQESSPEVVHEALRLGSHGYIDKTRARHLLPTVEAILDRGSAVGSSLPAGPPKRLANHGHQAQFYSDDTKLLETAERVITAAMRAGDAAMAVVTQAHLQQLLERLRHAGMKVDRAIESGTFVCLDADEAVSGMLSDGVARWQPALVQTIRAAAMATMRPQARVSVFGESAAILLAGGHVDKAIELEQLALELVDTISVEIVCAYPLRPVNHDAGFKSVCAHHGAIAIR